MRDLTIFPGYPPGTTLPVMRPEGTGSSGIMGWGESLGRHEEEDRLPFRPQADAGSVLQRALFRAGISRESLTLTNLVWYRPPANLLLGQPWEADAINVCRPLNDALVEKMKPRVLLAFGEVPFRELTGMVGKKQGILSVRGFIVPSTQYPGLPVVGTYHPSYLFRGSKGREKGGEQAKTIAAGGGTKGMGLLGILIRDILLAAEVAKNGVPQFHPLPHSLGATIEEWESALAELRTDPSGEVFYDLETWDSVEFDSEEHVEVVHREITQAQILYRVGDRIRILVSEWVPSLLPVFQAILELPNPKYDWNGREFDRPIMREYGIRTDIGPWIDLMDMWHHAQPDLPRGLQTATSFFCPEAGPWKHISHSDPLWYGALDVHMPWLVWKGLKRTMSLTRNVESGRSLLDGHTEQVLRLSPVLDRMHERGIGIDDEQRLILDREFTETQEATNARIQTIVPDEVRSVHPPEGYKRTNRLPPECLEAAGQTRLWEPDSAGGCPGEGEADGATVPSVSRTRVSTADGTVYVLRRFKDPLKGEVERWAELLPFLPNGGDQVKRYLKFKGYTIPRDLKTDKESTGEEGLRRLAKETGDPLIPLILESRGIGKARSTYVGGWAPAGDGRAHPIFTLKPATGQISSHSPNGQNFPKHDKADIEGFKLPKIARRLRRMIVASPGHHLIEADYKGFHILTLGFESVDPQYIRLGRIDMHSFFVLAGMLRLEPFEKVVELPDDELAAKLAWYRASERTYSEYGGRTFARIRDEIGKHAILAYGNGQQPRGLFMKNRDAFPTLKDAEKCQHDLDTLFPLPFRWKREIALKADRQAFLVSRYGYIRWFWDVFSRRPVGPYFQERPGQIVVPGADGRRWLMAAGDDHEAAISYLIQNDAFGIKRGDMVRLGEAGLDEKYGLITEIHDSLVFDCPDRYLDECLPTIKREMERPSPYLKDPRIAPEGLWCGVDISLGLNWDKKDAQNPQGMEKIKV